MSYFTYHPVLLNYIVSNTKRDVVDITARAAFVKEYKENEKLHVSYTVQDGERPEQIAHKLYGDINLYWIVMLFNEVHDIWNDWPLSETCFNEYIKREYPNEGYNKVKLYYSTLTNTIVDKPDNENADSIIPITYYDYEHTLNDMKRNIILPIPSEISNIVKYQRQVLGG